MIEGARLALVLGVAVAVDLAWGDPPDRWHPVAWLGRSLGWLTRRRAAAPRRELLLGAAVALGVPSLVAAGVAALEAGLGPWPWVQAIVGAVVLKSTFAFRGLPDAALAVQRALEAGDLEEARAGLRSLCSRDATALPPEAIVEAAVESVAENTSDGVVGPLLALLCFGIPGAAAYRAINTLDSMVGYRGRFEFLGKAAARLDDACNWVPARLTALAMLVVGTSDAGRRGAALRIWRRDACATPSPNAGHPMAAMAGLLGLRLRKPGVYALGDDARPAVPEDIARACRVARRTMLLVAGLVLAGLTARWG